jgi:hypothetical protein
VGNETKGETENEKENLLALENIQKPAEVFKIIHELHPIMAISIERMGIF